MRSAIDRAKIRAVNYRLWRTEAAVKIAWCEIASLEAGLFETFMCKLICDTKKNRALLGEARTFGMQIGGRGAGHRQTRQNTEGNMLNDAHKAPTQYIILLS